MTHSQPTSHPLLTPAILTVDLNGFIAAANGPALRLWRAAGAQLLGLPLVNLFSFTDTSAATGGAEAQWKLLVTNTEGRTVACRARLPDGGEIDVGVRLEVFQGAGSGYYVLVEDPHRHLESTPPMLVDSGLALLVEEAAVGFFDLNFKARNMYYSPAWKRMLGYGDNELANTYESWVRLIHPDDSSAAPDQAARRTAGGLRSFTAEMRMLHRDGRYVWVQCLGTQVIGTNGELERVCGLQIDIAERKEIEEQSVLNEERLQRLSADGGLVTFDFDFLRGRFWLAPGWENLVGSRPENGDSVLDAFLAALPPAVASRGVEAFLTESAPGLPHFQQAIVLRLSDERTAPVLLGAHRQLTRKGTLARAVGFVCPLPSDLSRVSELPLPASLVGETLATIAEAIIVADAHGRVVYLNPPAERLTGFGLQSSHGLALTEVFRLGKLASGEPDEDALELALAAADRTVLCADHSLAPAFGGPARPIVWMVRQIWGADGRMQGLVVVFRDPQEMTLSPEELLKLNRWESLGLVAGGIAHDFNNLLTTILGAISQAKDNHDSSFLADGERACLAAKALTKQLLGAARGGGSEVAQVLSLPDLLREAVKLARAGSNAEIRLNTPDAIAPVRINRPQMLQVFQNLVINAIQAVPPKGGRITLNASNTRLDEGAVAQLGAGDYVVIEIMDNGCGIPPENMEKIFGPFFTTKKQGTGLGLHTVRNIVLRHGGQINVSSTVGHGTTFSIYLPQAGEAAAEAEARRAPMLRSGTGRVLLMDDDPDIARLASGMLAGLDYKYDVARNGEEAIQLYRRYHSMGRPYDLVMLDLTVIGGMGGEETFLKMRELDPDVRAIVCSGYDSDEMARHYMELGFAGYLAKPFRLGDLARAIKSVLG